MPAPVEYNAEVLEDSIEIKLDAEEKLLKQLHLIAKERGEDLSDIDEKDGYPGMKEELSAFQEIARILSRLTPSEFQDDGQNMLSISDSRLRREEGEHWREQELWRRCAPYIEDGSYIEISDDASHFRWAFKDGKLHRLTKHTWPEPSPAYEVRAPPTSTWSPAPEKMKARKPKKGK